MNSETKLKIVLATRNQDKIREMRQLLQGLELEILTVDQFPAIPEVVEDRDTIAENALKKARVVADATQMLTLADDTGLEVDYLNGQPGVYSSRFAGENASYDDNCNKLLELMQGVPAEQRTARFRCVIAIVSPDFEEIIEGVCDGMIIDEKRGTNGFGYDPVFYVPRLGKTFAEMIPEQKNEISHRGIALRQARFFLQQWIKNVKNQKKS